LHYHITYSLHGRYKLKRSHDKNCQLWLIAGFDFNRVYLIKVEEKLYLSLYGRP